MLEDLQGRGDLQGQEGPRQNISLILSKHENYKIKIRQCIFLVRTEEQNQEKE